MTKDQFANLDVGDVVVGKVSKIAFVVVGNYGNHVTAVKVADITNPDEWHLLRKSV